MDIALGLVSTEEELEQILLLQSQFLSHRVSENEKHTKGFLTVKHSLDALRTMNTACQQVIAKHQGTVIGYALVMPKECRDLIPVLFPMFTKFDQVSYKGQALSQQNYYVMGQICVAEEYRRQGISGKLYQTHRECYSNRFDICITEVSSSNKPSLKAHEKIGFETIYQYRDATDHWNIVLWDWKNQKP
jgi:ribosomal protein S18 acetylase RimI-like enzyme